MNSSLLFLIIACANLLACLGLAHFGIPVNELITFSLLFPIIIVGSAMGLHAIRADMPTVEYHNYRSGLWWKIPLIILSMAIWWKQGGDNVEFALLVFGLWSFLTPFESRISLLVALMLLSLSPFLMYFRHTFANEYICIFAFYFLTITIFTRLRRDFLLTK